MTSLNAMKRFGPAGLLSFMTWCLAIAVAVPAQGQGFAGVRVTQPNGAVVVRSVDLEVKSEAGGVAFVREWDGDEWKFQGHWEGLSNQWRNLTGSQTADTTKPKTNGEGTPLMRVVGPPPPPEGCWVWVDDTWEPSGQVVRVGANGEIEGGVPVERSTPFNRAQFASGAQYVSLDYATLCAGMIGAVRSTAEVEGVRRGGELYLGSNGRYAFNDRSILEQMAIKQPVRQSGSSLESRLGSGEVLLVLEENPAGYRWSQREGDWSVYDEEGRLMGYGDGNGNTVWLLRDEEGTLKGVVDGTGQVLLRLFYEGGRLVEVRDSAVGDGTLPERVVKYEYDAWNRLVKVVDVLGHETSYGYDEKSRLVEVKDAEGRTERFEYRGKEVGKRVLADGGEMKYEFEYDEAHQQFISRLTYPETEGGVKREVRTHNRVGQLMRKEVNGLVEVEIQRDWVTRRERIVNGRGYATLVKKNSVGQVIEEEYADGTIVKRQYGFRHLNLQEETDELKVKTNY